ncbi:zinc ribbon domain-containing protein [uncultured Methanobrevibacter sp.]|uniref:zinc ribbon domain-containing protein n=1 Tax=uncultured Methanobrevibacter sp. TaxID=253161 RepID=UPI00261E2F6E|nr:zinc ribbon domain-containing protein [uncultured Methanobrevibacter sp.]
MTKYCPNCGEHLIDDAKFCKSCGMKLDGSQKTNPSEYKFTPPVVEKDYKLISLIGGAIGFLIFPLIGIIIGIYIYTRKDSSRAKTYGSAVIGVSVLKVIFNFLRIIFYI